MKMMVSIDPPDGSYEAPTQDEVNFVKSFPLSDFKIELNLASTTSHPDDEGDITIYCEADHDIWFESYRCSLFEQLSEQITEEITSLEETEDRLSKIVARLKAKHS